MLLLISRVSLDKIIPLEAPEAFIKSMIPNVSLLLIVR
jgi:hypothetical protein